MRELAKITEGIIGQPMFTIFKKVNEMERSSQKVYHFELGDWDFSSIYTCAPPLIQRAGIAALKGNQQVIEERIERFRMLRDLLVERLNEIPGISCPVPDGAYYVFPNIRDTGMSSAEFADFVLERAGVTLVPGTSFGMHGEGHVTMSFTREPEVIEEACARMKDTLSEFLSGTEESQTARL